jgi:hypothetical protein
MNKEVRRKLNSALVGTEFRHGRPCAYVHVQSIPVEIHTHNTLEPGQPQHDHLDGSVIAHQYSYANFVSFRFHSQKDQYGSGLKKMLFFSVI